MKVCGEALEPMGFKRVRSRENLYNNILVEKFIKIELVNSLIVSDLLSMCKNENLIFLNMDVICIMFI